MIIPHYEVTHYQENKVKLYNLYHAKLVSVSILYQALFRLEKEKWQSKNFPSSTNLSSSEGL